MLKGKIVLYHGWQVTGFTDGNDATASSLLAEGNAYNINDILSPTQYVNRVYIRASTKYDGLVGVTLTFVDGTKEKLTMNTTAGKGFYDYRDYYANVQTTDKMVKSFVVSGNPEHLFSEFDLERGDYNPVDPKYFVINNLTATRSADSNRSLVLSWDVIKSPYLDKYKVYKPDSSFETKNNTVTIDNLKPGQTLSFSVSAIDTFGNEYSKSVAIAYVVPDDPPAQPANFGAMLSKDRKTIDLSWMANEQSGFAGYNLYLVDGEDYKKLNNGLLTKNAFSFPVPGEETYKFALETVDKKGNASDKAFTTLRVAPLPVTETEQEAGPDYLLAKWSKTEGAIGYRIYLNGRLISSVGPTVFEYKITRAMGYIPGSISNKAEARAILADGTEGGSNNPTAPVLELGAGYGVGDAFKAGIEFVKLLNGWVLIALSIVLANMMIAFLYLLNKKYKITQRG
ncbi:fibronectin type III domain-containing protein [Paenibacillus polymyxa]|uniref:fibronectin type III domain-containing protein n=1 Tax=Paenibacillus polymyxa TaxID=1406 RepID=UPI003D278F19